ncbi:hypothetical protein [Streptomyces sp. NBC_01565]|uniref:hypothetical protein n=1 Tax=Streptomyces sp. NBC_01565 TaxID=2975881 RepID=UPI002256577B|nr:hypothetical protein [Streptomyces sp. NBC_01565]MCX4547221.1 hypothetical protein [Streptomyces sp. NBC_01565]
MTPTVEHLPAAIEVQCPVCGRAVTTGQSGNTTRCPKTRGGCGTPIAVPAGTTRPPVELDCYDCGHTWTTRAKAGSTVRCPGCSHPRRVPTAARAEDVEVLPPATPLPARRPAPPTAPRRAPAHHTAPRDRAEDDAQEERERAERRADTRRALAELRAALRPSAAPSAASAQAPRPAPAAPAARRAEHQPAQAHGRRFTPRPEAVRGPVTAPATARRRTAAAAFLDALGGALRLRTDAPHGGCEVLDPTRPPEHRACGQLAQLTVQFTDHRGRQTLVHACTTHAEALRYLATTRPGLRATLRAYSSA